MWLFFLDSWILKGDGTAILHDMQLHSDTVSKFQNTRIFRNIYC